MTTTHDPAAAAGAAEPAAATAPERLTADAVDLAHRWLAATAADET
nr:hypothetical protein [Cellulomonas hominis]